jgi:hypothetical protein
MIYIHETTTPTRSIHFDPLGFTWHDGYAFQFYERDANHSIILAIHSDKVESTQIRLVTSGYSHVQYIESLGHSPEDLAYFIPLQAIRDLCGFWLVLFPTLTPTACFDALREFSKHPYSEEYSWADYLDRCLKDMP